MKDSTRTPRIVTPKQALERLEALCARSERCSYEALQKMRTWRLSAADAQAVLDRLVDTRFIDDARFARAFVRDKVAFDRRGRLYLRQALAVKRIPRHIVDEALESIDTKMYADNLHHVMTVKVRSAGPESLDSFESRTRLYRYGVARGYEPALVADWLKAAVAQRRH